MHEQQCSTTRTTTEYHIIIRSIFSGQRAVHICPSIFLFSFFTRVALRGTEAHFKRDPTGSQSKDKYVGYGWKLWLPDGVSHVSSLTTSPFFLLFIFNWLYFKMIISDSNGILMRKLSTINFYNFSRFITLVLIIFYQRLFQKFENFEFQYARTSN